MRELFLIAGLVIALIIFGCWYWNHVKKKDAKYSRDLLDKAFAASVSVTVGFIIFLLQQYVISLDHLDATKIAVKEETRLIYDLLSIKNQTPDCGTGSYRIQFSFLPTQAIDRALIEGAFPSAMTRHLTILSSDVREHNRWTEFGFEILHEFPEEKSADKAKFQAEFLSNDVAIQNQAKMIYDCLTTGTSNQDKDCI
jgi:hypothetical protein